MQKSRYALLASSMLMLASCHPDPLYGTKLSAINESPVGPRRDGPAAIQISQPQIFARDALVNDRQSEREWLEKTVLPEARKAKFQPVLKRDLRSITALAAGLGLAFDPAKGASYDNARQTQEIQGQIERTRLLIELEKLKKQLDDVKAGKDVATAAGTGTTATPPGGPTEPDRKPIVDQLEKMVGDLRTALTTGLTPHTHDSPNPDEEYESRRVFETTVRADLRSSRLDDAHDLNGRSLYLMQFRATVFPGDERAKQKWGMATFMAEASPASPDDVSSLYLEWLSHATYRMNAVPTARKQDKVGVVPDYSYELLAGGVTSDKLFEIARTYVSRGELAGHSEDPCRKVSDPLAATGLNCETLYSAVPKGLAPVISIPFPEFADLKLSIFVNSLARKIDSLPSLRAAAYDSEIQQLVKTCGQSTERTGTLEDAGDNELVLAQSFHRSVTLLEGVLINRNAKNYKERRAEFLDKTSKVKSLEEEINKAYVLIQSGIKSEKEIKAIKAKLAEDEFRFNELRRYFIEQLTAFSNYTDVVSVINPKDVCDFVARTISVSPFVSVALEGLSSNRSITGEAKANLLAIVARWEGSVQSAHTLLGMLQRLDRSGGIGAALPSAQELKARMLRGLVPAAFVKALFRPVCLASGTSRESGYPDPLADGWWSGCRNGLQAGFLPLQTVKVHASSPGQKVLRASTAASAADAVRIALAMKAALPGQGIGADAGIGFAASNEARAQALESMPILVGFSGDQHLGSSQTVSQFGWVIGPRPRIDPKKREILLEQPLGTYDLVAELSIPSWWRQIVFRTDTRWIGNWHDAQVANPPLNSFGDGSCGGGSGEAGFGGPACGMVVDLPRTRADMDALTSHLVASLRSKPAQTTRITRVEPSALSICRTGEVSVVIYGADIWRGEDVFLDGQPAKLDSVRVLPDMEGIRATFPDNVIQSIVPKVSPEETASGGEKRYTVLTVSTRKGFDEFPIDLVGTRKREGDKVICDDTPPAPKKEEPKKEEPKGPRILSVLPATISGCDDDQTIVVTTTGLDAFSSAYLGAVKAEDPSNPAKAPAPPYTGLPSPDKKSATFELQFKGLLFKNVGLESVPLILHANGQAISAPIKIGARPAGCR